MGFRLRTPSPTTVIACIALFLALGGGGYIALAHGGAGVAKKKAKPGPPGPQGAPGAQGPQGGQGQQGIQGGVGPTAGFDSGPGSFNGGQPAHVIQQQTINLPTAGVLWVQGHEDASFTCGAQTCAMTYVLTVDGNPTTFDPARAVNGSTRDAPTNGLLAANATFTAHIDTFGVSAAVTAGPHIIRLERESPNDANVANSSDGNSEVGAILLGQ